MLMLAKLASYRYWRSYMAFLLIIISPTDSTHVCPFVMDLLLVWFGIHVQEFPRVLNKKFLPQQALKTVWK